MQWRQWLRHWMDPGEEFLCEACHLLKSLYSLTGFQHHLMQNEESTVVYR